MRKLDKDRLIAGADQIDTPRSIQKLHLVRDILDIGFHVLGRETVPSKGIDVAEHIAKAVVEVKALKFGRKIAANVGHHRANTGPRLINIASAHRIEKVHIDNRAARVGDRTGAIEAVQLFELAFDAVGDLGQGFFGSGTGHDARDDHCADGKGRVLFAAHRIVGHQPRDQ